MVRKKQKAFRDMMQQASLKFGFEAEDIPLEKLSL